MMVHAQWLLVVSPFPPLGPIRLSMFCFMLTGADTSEVRLPECRRHNHRCADRLATPVLHISPQGCNRPAHRQIVVDDQVFLTLHDFARKGWIECQPMVRASIGAGYLIDLTDSILHLQPQAV